MTPSTVPFRLLCDAAEASAALALPFHRALALVVEMEPKAPTPAPIITRRHEGTIGALEIVI